VHTKASAIVKIKTGTLPIIVVSQFFCTSLWFAGNSIVSDIAIDRHLEQNFLADVTSAIQFGFILGTLVFAIFIQLNLGRTF
jgi:hypothetical protein